MAKHSLKRTWPWSVEIEGAAVMLIFKRMAVHEFVAWERQYLIYGEGRGLGDLSAEQVTQRAEEALAWMRKTFEDYVTLPADELEIEGRLITTGADLFDEIGTNMQATARVLNLVWSYHRFDEAARKKLWSQSDSPVISDAPGKEVAGPKPDLIAASVDRPASVQTEDVSPVAP